MVRESHHLFSFLKSFSCWVITIFRLLMRNRISTQTLLLLLLVGISSEPDTSTSPMEQTEQEALYIVIRGFIGGNWNGSELYPDPCGWTPIQGISCDLFNGTWHVNAISIGPVQENSLECAPIPEFSPYLFELRSLKSLFFYDCFRHPIAIPSQDWEKLAGSLEILEFRLNPGLVGEIPQAFGSLTHLQSLVLIENGLTGELPMGLGNLSKLKQLVLSGNRFSGRIPESLGNLTELLILDLSRNSLSGPMLSIVGRLNSLLKLDLSNNSLEGKLPSELGNLKNLTLLDLRNNKFSNGLPESLQSMESLQEILLSNNPIGGTLMQSRWENLRNLTIMDFSNMGLSGEIPDSIGEMRRLRFLGLDHNRLSGAVPPKLGELPCVRAIHLIGNNLTGEIGFSDWFLGEMGRRFAVWNNPNLCYQVGLISKANAPFGVRECGEKASVSSSGWKIEMGSGDFNENNSLMESSGYGIAGFLWGFWVEKIVVAFALDLLL